MGAVMLALLALMMCVGTTFAVLTILPSTQCLTIAGGSGC